MQNLVLNQHGIYTYRRNFYGKSVRLSLLTRDKLEALRLVEHINTLTQQVKPDNLEEFKRLVTATLNKFQPVFKQQRLRRAELYLGLSLDVDEGELLSVLIDRFIGEKLRSKAWAEKTHIGYRVVYQSLISLLKDRGIKTITPKDAQYVKASLQKLPANLNKKAEYRNKPISKLLTMTIPEAHLMSIKTINTMLGCYSELFKWSVKNGYTTANVFDGLFLKDTRNARELRSPFSPEDLKRIFNDEAIKSPKKQWQQWMPVLGLYTGARLNELCQLQRKDVIQVKGVWCLSINGDGANQVLKSASSKRLIPIHSKLIALGFIDFVNGVGSAPSSRLFPDLGLLNERFSHTPSRWFSYIKNRLLTESSKKSFHSFRHTFVDYLFNKLKLQGNPLVKALLGHTDNEITSGVYGSSFEVEDLSRIIEAVDFEPFGVVLTGSLGQRLHASRK